VGWKKTAAIWLAHDRDTDIVYAYSEHYRGQAEAPIHAKGIRLRGDWIPGVIDTAARGRSQVDGKTLWKLYEDEGLILHKANKAVEAGLMEVLDRLSTGRLKIFSTLQHTLGELRLYRRDEKGRIVKENDHLCDGLRYGILKINTAITRPAQQSTNSYLPGDPTAGY